MGMTSRVKGFVSPEDPTYKKYAKVLIACLEAGINDLPKEAAAYFDCTYAAEYLLEEKLEVKIPYTEYNADMTEGFEIIVADIPKGVHKIRFTNNY